MTIIGFLGIQYGIRKLLTKHSWFESESLGLQKTYIDLLYNTEVLYVTKTFLINNTVPIHHDIASVVQSILRTNIFS